MSSEGRHGVSRVFGAASGAGASARWFGDGSDGDLIVPANETVEIAVEEDVGRIVKQYNTLTINAGGVLKPAHRCNGVVLLIKGDCDIYGQLSVDKCAPLLNSFEEEALSLPQIELCGALLGGDGGDGGTGIDVNGNACLTYGYGGKGGKGHRLGGGFAGGGGAGQNSYSAVNHGGDAEPRPPYGITWPFTYSGYQSHYPGQQNNYPTLYGMGGTYVDSSWGMTGAASPGGSGAIHASGSTVTPGDGYGGGALWLFVGGTLTVHNGAKITADGGIGGHNNYTSSWNASERGGTGGSGGGGIIAIVYQTNYLNFGSVHANGGIAPTNYAGNTICQGQAGLIGTVFTSPISNLA